MGKLTKLPQDVKSLLSDKAFYKSKINRGIKKIRGITNKIGAQKLLELIKAKMYLGEYISLLIFQFT